MHCSGGALREGVCVRKKKKNGFEKFNRVLFFFFE